MPATAASPTPFVAMHCTGPTMWRFFTSTSSRRLLSRWSDAGLSLYSHVMIGCGMPFASHTISNIEPTSTSTRPLGCDIMLGASVNMWNFSSIDWIELELEGASRVLVLTLNFYCVQLRFEPILIGHHLAQIVVGVGHLYLAHLQAAVIEEHHTRW